MVARPRLCTVNALARLRTVDVNDHVDAGSVEDGGAVVVVQRGVDVVHADGVGTELLEHDGIAQADRLVRQGVTTLLRLVACLASGLVVDADNDEALLAHAVDEILALDLDGMDRDCDAGQEPGDRRKCVQNLLILLAQRRRERRVYIALTERIVNECL